MMRVSRSKSARWPSAEGFIAGVAFAVPGAFSDPNPFAAALVGEAKIKDTATPAEIVQQLDAFSQAWRLPQKKLTQESALSVLLAQDAAKIAEFVRNADEQLLRPESVEAATTNLIESAGHLGFDVSFAELRVVDEFPSPYRKMTFAAMTYDRMDEKLFDIRPGVALRRDQLKPFYSIALFAHELVHVAIGNQKTRILARGLEEGIADIVGQLMLAAELLPVAVCEQILWNSRTRYGRDQLGRLYRDALVSASTACLLIGDGAILALVHQANREGRSVIHDFERALAAGQVKGHGDGGRCTTFAQRFLAMTPELVVSPLAHVLATNIQLDEQLKDAFKRLNIPSHDGDEAVDELQSRVYLTTESNGMMSANEAPFYQQLGHLRYDVKARSK
jgi:hypothetical protein